MTKCYCNKYFVSNFVFLGLRVHFDKVFIGQVIYKTAWQILVGYANLQNSLSAIT